MQNENDFIKELDAEAIRIVDLLSRRVQESTVAIYYHELEAALSIKPELVATGVLIKTATNYYLITAAHTFQNYQKEDICIYKKDIKIPLVGRLYLFDINDSQVNDLVDIAIIKLDSFIVERLLEIENIVFLESKLIQQNHKVIPSKSYFTIGFPFKKEKVKLALKRFAPQPYLMYFHPSKIKSYDQPLVDKRYNILMAHNRRKQRSLDTGKRVTAPHTEGMSGSGLWFIPKFRVENDDKLEVKLIGIFIELKIETNSLMFTRIDCVTEVLRKYCEEDFEPFLSLKLTLAHMKNK